MTLFRVEDAPRLNRMAKKLPPHLKKALGEEVRRVRVFSFDSVNLPTRPPCRLGGTIGDEKYQKLVFFSLGDN